MAKAKKTLTAVEAIDTAQNEASDPAKQVECSVVDEVAERIRGEIKTLQGDLEGKSFELADRLYFAFAENLYRKWGYDTWEDYCENELSLGVRHSNMLKKIHEWYVIQNNDKTIYEAIKPLGWTKAKILTGIISGNNKDEWMEIAKDASCRELEGKVRDKKKALRDGKGTPKDKNLDVKHRVSVDLYNEQALLFDQACSHAGEVANTEVRGQQLALVCQDYLASNTISKDKGANLIAYLSRIESMLGLKLMAVDLKINKIVYGNDFLEQVEEMLKGKAAPEGHANGNGATAPEAMAAGA